MRGNEGVQKNISRKVENAEELNISRNYDFVHEFSLI